MTPELMAGLAQGGAIFLLCLVLIGISRKIDALLVIAKDFATRLLDIVEITIKDSATRTQEVTQEVVKPPTPKI